MRNQPSTSNYNFGHQPERTPIMAVDPGSGRVYDVASLIAELNHPSYVNEPLEEKLDLFIQNALAWVDDHVEIATVREMMQVMYRLRDAVAAVKICNEGQPGGTK